MFDIPTPETTPDSWLSPSELAHEFERGSAMPLLARPSRLSLLGTFSRPIVVELLLESLKPAELDESDPSTRSIVSPRRLSETDEFEVVVYKL